MPSLKEVKNRINSVNSTQQITKAMKMVAAAKLRRAQDRIIQMRPYSQKLEAILENVTATLNTDSISNPFAEERAPQKVLLVLITSDRGLCGGFNSNVTKAARQVMEEQYASQLKSGNLELLCIGSKGLDFFKRRDYPINEQFANLFHNLNFDEVKKAAEYVMDGFLSGKYDRVDLIYNEFKNVATQLQKVEQFLPLQGIAEDASQSSGPEIDYIFEPDKEEIVSMLIPKTLKIIFYRALLESNAGEQGARMTAMDKATDNAAELLKELKLTYNRTRQAAITKEILEIVGGAEALAAS